METTSLTLDQLSARLKALDRLVIMIAARRMEYAEEVARIKMRSGEVMFRPEIEDRRLAQAREWAVEDGLNPNFAHMHMYGLIGESCKRQTILREGPKVGEPAIEEGGYGGLKQNLLRLTEKWSDRSYNTAYGDAHLATQAFQVLEQELVYLDVAKLPHHHLALDLGCATGRSSFHLAKSFDRVLGIDLSQHMVAAAAAAAKVAQCNDRVVFEQADLEERIPVEDGSASFVLMNLGTGSDVRDFAGVWKEIQRVLAPGGRFHISFYNANALIYHWAVMPWPSSLAAVVSPHRNCLEVRVDGETFSLYARPYLVSEVKEMLAEGTSDLSLQTHPTISAFLPPNLLEGDGDMRRDIEAIDVSLASGDLGAYIIARGAKV